LLGTLLIVVIGPALYFEVGGSLLLVMHVCLCSIFTAVLHIRRQRLFTSSV